MPRMQAYRLCGWLGALVFCFGLSDIHAEEACDTPQLLSPSGIDIANAKPRFEWTTIADAKRYRLWLESRLPEGRVLFTHDIQTTSTYWIPPAALTETRALLKVKLTAICGEEAGNDAMPVRPPFARFRIDTSVSCALPAAPVITLSGQGAEVSWSAVAGAEYYELSAYSGVEAQLARKSESRVTKFQFDRLSPGVWVIAVRPRCSSGYGAYRFRVLNL